MKTILAAAGMTASLAWFAWVVAWCFRLAPLPPGIGDSWLHFAAMGACVVALVAMIGRKENA